jgi:hypothetical protein
VVEDAVGVAVASLVVVAVVVVVSVTGVGVVPASGETDPVQPARTSRSTRESGANRETMPDFCASSYKCFVLTAV